MGVEPLNTAFILGLKRIGESSTTDVQGFGDYDRVWISDLQSDSVKLILDRIRIAKLVKPNIKNYKSGQINSLLNILLTQPT